MSSATQQLLDEHSTKKYHYEYMEFRSNHISHGIIALDRLGAPPDKINSFIDWYSKSHLTESIPDELGVTDIESLKGKRVSYYLLRDHYAMLLDKKYKTIEQMIKEEFPKLTLGISGSALHCLIHLGYGYAARNKTLVCEGLAYLFHSYNPPVISAPLPSISEFGTGERSVTDAVNMLAADTELRQRMLEGVTQPEWESHEQGPFQLRLTYLLKKEGDLLAEYISSLKAPDGIADESGEIDVVKLGEKVVGIAVLVYATSENVHDFFLLHGVTAAWSLLQLLPVLTKTDGLETIRQFLIVLFAVYVTQDSPALTKTQGISDGITEKDWKELIAKTRALPVDTDEHVYKLVQVCSEMAKADSGNAGLYYKAGRIAVENEFHFGDYLTASIQSLQRVTKRK